jgi:hypothetical protein
MIVRFNVEELEERIADEEQKTSSIFRWGHSKTTQKSTLPKPEDKLYESNTQIKKYR